MIRPVAALTGGTGFLGRYVARALHAAGWQVRLLVRRPPSQPLLAELSPEFVQGDLGDRAALERLVRGSTAVVHSAGLVRARSQAEFDRVNRDGSAAVADAARRMAPEARLLLVSSQAARAPEVSPYAASKHAGEIAFTDAAGPSSWVILRPPAIYGAGDTATPALLKLARSRFAPVPSGVEPRLGLIHAADAAEAIAVFCGAEAPTGCRFELCDARLDGYGWREILAICAAAQDRDPPFALPVPDTGMLLAGRLADGWNGLFRRAGFFGTGKAREILHRDWRPDIHALPPTSLWKPRISASDGFREMADWLRTHPGEG
ncbi:NAD-dependent epimerase/dehydratase family protein [Roseomonas elaeocarpi]|uniref:NAD-dependent epimerase/dehydratase family protein n=1 Tax=Roseomonas elaeocarpi TaxID=907779 RepID=A0ABV6JQN9_9PROT